MASSTDTLSSQTAAEAYACGQRDMQRRAVMTVLQSAGAKLPLHDINLLQQAAQAVLDLEPTLAPSSMGKEVA